MSAFAQTNTGDLDISTGNLVVRKDVGQVTAWKLTNLFSFFKGEWFRDQRQGLPYVQYVLINNPNLRLISTIFERVIRAAPGVGAVTDIKLDFRARERKLYASFAAIANDGSKLTGGLGEPFIVSVKPNGGLGV